MKQDGTQSDEPPVRTEELLIQHILTILQSPSASAAEEVPLELRDLKDIETLHNLLWGIRRMAESLSKGNLDYQSKARGFVAGSLKAFQANLRHLTWQAQRIAEGEYSHRVNFLGDFSVAFNQMAEQLASTINNLTCLSEEYKDLSHRDALTGIYNRYAFFKFSEQLLLKCSRLGRPASLFIADIDKFKNINDTFGHLCGDAVLKSFAALLISGLRSEDLCCRYGGEEFIVLMPETPLEVSRKVAERLRVSTSEMEVLCEGYSLHITSSFGLIEINQFSTADSFANQLNTYIQKADALLYEAKSSGRNRVCC